MYVTQQLIGLDTDMAWMHANASGSPTEGGSASTAPPLSLVTATAASARTLVAAARGGGGVRIPPLVITRVLHMLVYLAKRHVAMAARYMQCVIFTSLVVIQMCNFDVVSSFFPSYFFSFSYIANCVFQIFY